ncbi:MAG: TRAP transporter substrate-binding protein [Spirochaetales bacterium]|nr:TRAP transporter substrate-binding protein [Spirochaetales bacterium]
MRKSLTKMVIFGLLLLSMVVSCSKKEAAAPAEKEVITLVAASMFDSTHPFNKCYEKFGELVNEYQDEVVIDLQISESKALGVETDFFRFMSQGESVDIAILAPGNISKRIPSIAIVDMPLIFKSVEHRNKVLASEHFAPIAQEAIDKGNIRIIGFAGGASRSIISNYAITDMDTLQGFKLRVMGAPIWAKVFDSVGAVPSVIAYDEVYSAVQTGVIQGLENEKVGFSSMRFFEVAPHYTMNEHAITVRPLFISESTFKKLSPTVQAAVLKAGKEAGEYGSQYELDMADAELAKLVDAGLAYAHEFSDEDKAEFRRRATPALMEFVEENGFTDLYNAIQSVE